MNKTTTLREISQLSFTQKQDLPWRIVGAQLRTQRMSFLKGVSIPNIAQHMYNNSNSIKYTPQGKALEGSISQSTWVQLISNFETGKTFLIRKRKYKPYAAQRLSVYLPIIGIQRIDEIDQLRDLLPSDFIISTSIPPYSPN